ncbi:hypothetical protein [Streptomyces sp. NPDC051310]|uniref:hypothetical protein n=1 Tax=Streptomyces sp. NPDC051310 TaxID=3365649 RepID=UPI00379C5AD9
MNVLMRVTYTYVATDTSVRTVSCTRLADPDAVIRAAAEARRKRDWIWIIDHEQGVRHAFPADRLVDVVTEPQP